MLLDFNLPSTNVYALIIKIIAPIHFLFLFIIISISLSDWLCISLCLCFWLSIALFLSPFVSISVYLFVFLFACLSMCVCVCVSFSVFSLYIYNYLPVYLSKFLYISMSFVLSPSWIKVFGQTHFTYVVWFSYRKKKCKNRFLHVYVLFSYIRNKGNGKVGQYVRIKAYARISYNDI